MTFWTVVGCAPPWADVPAEELAEVAGRGRVRNREYSVNNSFRTCPELFIISTTSCFLGAEMNRGRLSDHCHYSPISKRRVSIHPRAI